jgi:hypothetical protein
MVMVVMVGGGGSGFLILDVGVRIHQEINKYHELHTYCITRTIGS